MGVAEIFLTAVRLTVLMAGLLLPGAALLRALRLPVFLAGAFVGSAATVYGCILTFTVLRIPIDALTVGAALVAVTCLGEALGRRAERARPEGGEATSFFAVHLGHWSFLYALLWGVLLWRIITQPLNGGDIDFRWSWLAEQMVRFGTLDFYPPVTATDFTRYFWVESIPPGVAGLHAWGYLCGGSFAELWTAPGVLLQLLALHDLVWRLATAWSTEPVPALRAARRAVLIAGAAPLLNWSVLIGQETGITALAVTALLFALTRWHQTRRRRWLAFAAVAAVLGAGAREYGLAFPLLGIVVLLMMRAPVRALLWFGAAAFVPALIWPARVWFLTGNPVYSLNVATLLPTNALFVEWSGQISAGSARLLATADGWRQLGRYLALGAPLAALGWLAVAADLFRRRERALWCAGGVGAVIFIWYHSLPYTGGGLFYSMRLLSPAFALGATYAGCVLGTATDARLQRGADLVLAAVFVLALPLTLTLPHNAYHVPWTEWTEVGKKFVVERRSADLDVSRQLQRLPDHERILTECVSLPRALHPAGITAIPMWSPEVAWLFDRQLPPAERARRWRVSGLRYIVMTRSPAQLELLARRAAWTLPHFSIRRIWESDGYVIFDVTAPPLPHH